MPSSIIINERARKTTCTKDVSTNVLEIARKRGHARVLALLQRVEF